MKLAYVTGCATLLLLPILTTAKESEAEKEDAPEQESEKGAASSGKLSKEELSTLKEVCGKRSQGPRFKVACQGGKKQCPLALVGEHPWAVRVLTPGEGGGTTPCSGTLVSQRHVLTAAHCLYDIFAQPSTGGSDKDQGGFQTACFGGERAEDEEEFDRLWQKKAGASWSVQMGAVDLAAGRVPASARVVGIQTAYVQKGWCKRKGFSGTDLGILELSESVELSGEGGRRAVWPACVAGAEDELPETLTVAGFGDDASAQGKGGGSLGRLLVAQLDVKPDSEDNKEFLVSSVRSSVCAGDSGGGLVGRSAGTFRLFGLVSLGAGCAKIQNPNVRVSDAVRKQQSTSITDVRAHAPWICKRTGIC